MNRFSSLHFDSLLFRLHRAFCHRGHASLSPPREAQRAKCQGRRQFHREWQCRDRRYLFPIWRQLARSLLPVTRDHSASVRSAFGHKRSSCPSCLYLSSANSLQQFASTKLCKSSVDFLRDKSPQRAWIVTAISVNYSKTCSEASLQYP